MNTTSKKGWRIILVAVGMVVGLLGTAGATYANPLQSMDPTKIALANGGVFSPPAAFTNPDTFSLLVAPFGRSPKELSAEWWQFVSSIPTPANPLLDDTGANCMVGQRGSIWFLAGTFSGGPATRTCSIPEGKVLFFPVVNYVNIDTPGVCGQGASMTVDELRAISASFIDGATNLSVEVDNQPIKHLHRIKSPVFEVTFPADNIFNSACSGAGGFPGGTYSPAVDDGFYAMLKPLSVGQHTLRIRGEVPSASFSLDVTYHLTVVPVRLK